VRVIIPELVSLAQHTGHRQYGEAVVVTRRSRPGAGIDSNELACGKRPPTQRTAILQIEMTSVDRLARQRLSDGLRQLASGRIDSDEFQDNYVGEAVAAGDPGVRAVFLQGAWHLYGDYLRAERFSGLRRLPREQRRLIARWILFLDSNLAYEWPLEPIYVGLLLLPANLLTLGAIGRWRLRRWKKFGEFSVWPFIRWKDYRAALRCPRRLSGESS
jgi:hypothetical protein